MRDRNLAGADGVPEGADPHDTLPEQQPAGAPLLPDRADAYVAPHATPRLADHKTLDDARVRIAPDAAQRAATLRVPRNRATPARPGSDAGAATRRGARDRLALALALVAVASALATVALWLLRHAHARQSSVPPRAPASAPQPPASPGR
jgi:hypothetical protein